MVIGPTADDDTAFCLKAYWDGLYGKVGSDAETRLFFETNEYLCEACDNELEGGKDALYEYINC